jgi:hypothetical protein
MIRVAPRKGTKIMADHKANRMTNAERSELLSLIRKREKVMKTMASERSAQMFAEFEAQAAKIYDFNEDAVWAKAKEEAERAVAAAREDIAERCRQLGIPAEFAPDLSVGWHGRGENAFAFRMSELRRAAKKRIEAIEAEAITKIERMSLESQTALLANGLDTDVARAFLAEAQNDMANLMPSITAIEVEKMMEPTLRKQLAHQRWDLN